MPASKYCFGFETLFRTTIVTSGPVVSINVRDDADADADSDVNSDADTDLNADAVSDLKYYSGRLPSPTRPEVSVNVRDGADVDPVADADVDSDADANSDVGADVNLDADIVSDLKYYSGRLSSPYGQ